MQTAISPDRAAPQIEAKSVFVRSPSQSESQKCSGAALLHERLMNPIWGVDTAERPDTSGGSDRCFLTQQSLFVNPPLRKFRFLSSDLRVIIINQWRIDWRRVEGGGWGGWGRGESGLKTPSEDFNWEGARGAHHPNSTHTHTWFSVQTERRTNRTTWSGPDLPSCKCHRIN